MENYLQFSAVESMEAIPPRTHYHRDYEVYYLTEGRCRYFIDNKTYPMNPGDMVLIPPGVIHKVLYDTQTHSRLLINCTEDYIPASARKRLEGISWFPGKPEATQQIKAIFDRIREADSVEDDLREDTVRYLAMGLFLIMAKSARPAPIGDALVEKAVGYIQSRYAQKVTLTEAAQYCAVSPEHLSRLFKRDTGFGFNEYLNLYRLKKADAMLRSGSGKTVSKIARACGFSDSNYFSAAYKKCHGFSPSKVKKQTEKEETYV